MDGLKWMVIDIGDWDMDTNSIKSVNLGGTGVDGDNIRYIEAVIRPDSGETQLLRTIHNSESAGSGGIERWSTSSILLSREASGIFDSTAFDQTSYNRGWVTVAYV
jgi:hypothetical protein